MLQDLFAGAIADANSRAQVMPKERLLEIISNTTSSIDVYSLLRASTSIQVIAEIKRASPSKGDLAAIPDPAALARRYQESGAAVISVLTEERKFKGSLDDLIAVRKAVDIPILRKDFIANEYQILEAKAFGADLILLIVAGLNQPQLEHLYNFAMDLGLAALVETHSAEEVARAVSLGAKLIGINARDLSTFETDLNLFGELVTHIQSDAIAIAESAVKDLKDVEHYAAAGASAVLVGEALVKGVPEVLIPEFSSVAKTRIV